jgi:DNA-binding PadR family transcriptional regulator
VVRVLDLAILGLLEERDLHGYEIRKQLRETLGLLANVSFGSLYPALARLEQAGAVEATEEAAAPPGGAAPVPPTGSLTGERAVLRARRHAGPRARRSRKVYRITDAGRVLFSELLTAPATPDDARGFGLRLAFARHLAPQARLALLERRRVQLHQRLHEVRAASGDADLDEYARSVVDHTAESVEQDIRWLDRLIERERAEQEAAPEQPATRHQPAPAAPPPNPTPAPHHATPRAVVAKTSGSKGENPQ